MAAGSSAIRLTSVGVRQNTLRAAGVLLFAVGLTVVFWLALWTGGGLVGSDIYAYFLPQKAFFAEQLRDGAIPVWNNLIGWGYPQLAESQTGVFYPLNLPLYYLLDLNSAFNASQIVHYVLAFVFTWMLAREIGLTPIGAGLSALVFTYGWFPTRVCLEWAIVGGAWMPLAFWCVERFLNSSAWRFAIALTVVLGIQMLAGHFTLAFVTQIAIAAYVPLRLWSATGKPTVTSHRSRRAACGILAVAIAGAFLLAAVQLLPTWELKRQSQRKAVTAEHDPAYGYIPARYLMQAVAPWHWYIGDKAFNDAISVGGPRTNRVEAHLYFGLLPIGLAVWSFWATRRRLDRRLILWLGLGLASVIYAVGVVVPVTKHLPGFSFFEGCGRFGIVATLAVALWAGFGLDRLLQRCRGAARKGVIAFVFISTIGDLWLVSRQAVSDPWFANEFPVLVGPQSKFVFLVDRPPIQQLQASPLRSILAKELHPVRLFSEGKNLPSMLGVATLPTYLGLGPSAYFEPDLQLPGEFDFRKAPTEEQIAWFRRAGVTHFLSFVPLASPTWPVAFVWAGPDLFLNQTLARGREEPLFLYRLTNSRNRVAWGDVQSDRSTRLVEYRPHQVAIETAAKSGGRLILTDLSYPGWQVTVDGESAEPLIVERVFRGVEVPAGNHTVVWTYRPWTLYWGAGTSLVTLVVLLILGHLRFWHADWFQSASQSTENF